MPICIYPSDCTDFSTNGLGVLTPISCIVTEEEGGMFELEVTQPIDSTNRWAQLVNGAIIKAPVPTRESPIYSVPYPEKPAKPKEPEKITRNVWTVTTHISQAGAFMRNYPVNYKGDLDPENYDKYKNGIPCAYLSPGTKITELEKKTVGSIPWIHGVLQRGGREGWVPQHFLTLTGTVDEVVEGTQVAPPTGTTQRSVTPLQSSDQLFRIYNVERDTKEQTVTASAMHIFYDLRANLVQLEPEKAALEQESGGDNSRPKRDIATVKRKADAVINSIWANLAVKDNPFILHLFEGVDAEIQGDYSWKNPIECLLDPDEGILTQARARLVRDNYNIYITPDGIRDTGVTIRRGKNLKGVTVTEDAADIVTRIIPCGRDADGKDLFLDSDPNYVDSPLIDNYPFPYVQKIDYDVRVLKPKEGEDSGQSEEPDNETTFADNASARAKLKELAQKDFEDNGVDLPTYGMEVDFVLLQNSPDSSEDYAALQAVFLGDTVTVIDSIIKLTAKIRVTGYEWDAITRQYTKVTLGQVDSLDQIVYSYNIPSGGISGSKIAPGSMSGNVLRDLTIQYAKIDQATIDQLVSNSLTAVEAHIDELIAGHITADKLTAGLIEAMTGIIENLKVGKLDADDLTARFAEFGVLLAGSAEFDRETVQHLVAEALHLSFGEADSVFIQNLMVTYAQFAAATIGDLVVKASDGNYYHLDVDPETGTVTATKAEDVTEGDISSGHTSTGETIIDTNILAENLSTNNLFATYALINSIDAARIDVDQLFAREAFLDLLWTTQIHGDESIEMWVHNSVRRVVTEYYVSESPSIPAGGEWTEEFPGTVASDKYLWRHIKSYKGQGEYEVTSEECLTLSAGAQGPAGVGIESIEEFYGLSNSADVQPTEWQPDPMPPTPDNRWLWNKETIHYTNQTTQDGEPHIIGVFGQDGKIGRGIKEIINWYLASDQSAGITRGSAGWTQEIQTTDDEMRFLWNYEETVWNDDSPHSYTNPIIIGTQGKPGQQGLQGLQGEKGEDGIDGSPGKDGSDGSSINLLLGTRDFSGSWTNRDKYSEDEPVGDFTVLTKTAAWGGVNQKISVEPGSYTFSCWVKTGASGLIIYYTPSAADAESKKLNTWTEDIAITPNTWTHIVGHVVAREAATLNPRIEIKTATDVSLYGYKLEAGNVAKPVWSPNPADLATYFHIKYSAKENPTTAADMTETPDVYIGTYVDNVKEDSTDPKSYQWYRFQGLQGPEGKQGIPGIGQDGKTYYLHIKYSNDGGKTFTGNSGEDSGSYIGVCTDTNEADPTDVSKYKWSGIKGEPGSQGINLLRRTAEYACSAKGTNTTLTKDGDFTYASLPMVASGGNEWGNNIVSLNIPFSNVRNQTATLSLDVKCDDVSKYTSGTNGLYFAVQLYYEGSGRQFVQNINPFRTITLSADWTRVRQVIDCHDAKFTRESSNTSYNIGDDTLINIAVYNRSTTTGLHIRKLKLELGDVPETVWTPNPSDVSYTPHPQYYLSTSATTQTGGSWSETQPTWESGKYLWERLRLVWSDGRADTYTTPQRALALEQALQNAQTAQDTANSAQDLANQAYTILDRYMTLTDDRGWEFHANIEDPETGEEVPSIWVSRIDERGFYVQRTDIGQFVFAACRDRCLVSNLEIGKINYAPMNNSNTEAETNSNLIMKPTSTGGILFTTK